MKTKKLVCALLALMCVASLLAGCDFIPSGKGPKIMYDSFGIAKAVYPAMAQYPDERDPDFREKNEAWLADRRVQLNQPEGYRDGLNPYFAASMKEFLSGAGNENRVYSPVNVFMALSMLAELTDNNSRAQILALLGADSIDSLRAQASAVWNANYSDDGAVTSILANSLWLNRNVSFKQETMNTLAEKYYASSFRGDVASEEFSKALQSWLDEQTGGLLTEQASQIEFDPQTIMALATTIFYQAKWSSDFRKEATKDGVFRAKNGDITCEFMNQSVTDSFYRSERYTAVAKRLEGSGNMYFILPNEGTDVDELLADDKTYDLFLPESADVAYSYARINLSVPRFDVVSDIDLIDGLIELGVTDVFSFGKSDFSPMTDDTDEIAVTQAKHAARVKIDEEGVTAVAYTVMMACGTAEPGETVDFVLDRPFIFVITGSDGLPLFTGVVNSPK